MKGKKLLALVLCLLMTVSMLPISAFADGDGYGEITINLGGGEGGGQQNSDTYVVAGSANENVNEGGVATPIFGTAWDPTLAANQMTESNGVYTKTYTVSDACNVQFKVVKNGTTWIGNSDESNVSVSIPAGSKFTVNLNPSTNAITTSVTMDYTSVYITGNGYDKGWLDNLNWNASALQMTEVQTNVWQAQVPVPAGSGFEMKFTIDGSWTRNFGRNTDSSITLGNEYNADWGSGNNIKFNVTAATTLTVQLDLRNFNYETQTGAKFKVKAGFTVSSITYSTNGTVGSSEGGSIRLKSPKDYMNRPIASPAGTTFTFEVDQYAGYDMTLTAYDESGAAVEMYEYAAPTVNEGQGKTTYTYALDIPASDVTVHAAFNGQRTYHYVFRPSLISAGVSMEHRMSDEEKLEVIDVCSIDPEYPHEGEVVTATISPKAGYFVKFNLADYDTYNGTLTQTGPYTFTFTAQQNNSHLIYLSTVFGVGLDQGYYVQIDDAARTDWIPLVNEFPFYGGVTTVWDGQASLTAGQVLTAWYVDNPGSEPVQTGSPITVESTGNATIYYVKGGAGALYVSDLNGYYLVHANVTGTHPYEITEEQAFTAQTDGSYTYDGVFKGDHWIEIARYENGKVVELCVSTKTNPVDVPRNNEDDDEDYDGFPYDGAAGRATLYPNADGTNCNVKENVLRVSRIFNIGYSEAYSNFTVYHLDAIHNNNTAAAGETVNLLVTPHAGTNYIIVSVTAAQGTTPVPVTAGANNTYSFVMTAGDVIVTVETAPPAPAASLAFLGAGLQRRVLNATGEIIAYETNIRFGFELTLPDGAVVDTDASYFRWNLTTEATADTGNKIDIKNVDTTGAKPVVNMVITGVPKSFYSTNITCFVHLVYTVGGNSYVLEQGGFVRSVVQVCNGLLNSAAASDAWKAYAQSLLDAISE